MRLRLLTHHTLYARATDSGRRALPGAGVLLVFAALTAFGLQAPIGEDRVLVKETAATPAPLTADRVAAEAEPLPLEQLPGKLVGSGTASFYGNAFAGCRTASGERFSPSAMTAAHRTLPFGSKVRVTNTRNGRSVIVRINDRGPFHGNRVIDLSRAAARELGFVRSGTAPVKIELLPARG